MFGYLDKLTKEVDKSSGCFRSRQCGGSTTQCVLPPDKTCPTIRLLLAVTSYLRQEFVTSNPLPGGWSDYALRGGGGGIKKGNLITTLALA